MRAVVDIGSNSIKFCADIESDGDFNKFKTFSVVTRLGQGLDEQSLLSRDSLAASKLALAAIHSKLQEYGKGQKVEIQVVATAAVRDSKNSEELTKIVSEELNCKTHILSGTEEAAWSMKGAAEAAKILFPQKKLFQFIEVGGASTQIGILDPKFIGESYKAGAVRCHERLGFQESPISNEIWDRGQKEIANFYPEKQIEDLKSSFGGENRQAIAIGGSLVLATRLAGAKGINAVGFYLDRSRLEKFNEGLRKKNIDERKSIAGMENGRADIICAGILCLTHLLRRFEFEDYAVTSWGLRHGILRNWDDFKQTFES